MLALDAVFVSGTADTQRVDDEVDMDEEVACDAAR
jgi:hypothetical protein